MTIENPDFSKGSESRRDDAADLLSLQSLLTTLADFDSEHEQLPRETIDMLRSVPGLVADGDMDEGTRSFIAQRFESLPPEILHRLVRLDFSSPKALRTFAGALIEADFSDDLIDDLIVGMKDELYSSPYVIDQIFDLDRMDENVDASEEDEDDSYDGLQAEGEERKAMVPILTYLMLPMNAKFYDQIMDAVQTFNDADYDIDKLDSKVLTALPLIEELGKIPDEMWLLVEQELREQGVITDTTRHTSEAVRDLDTAGREWTAWESIISDLSDIDVPVDASADDLSARWTTFISQLIVLDSETQEWQQMLRTLKDLQATANDLIAELSDTDPDSQEWIDLHRALRDLHPNGIFSTGKSMPALPTAEELAEAQAKRDQAANKKLNDILSRIRPQQHRVERYPQWQQQPRQQHEALFDRNRDKVDAMSDDDIIKYLKLHEGGTGFLANMYAQVAGYGIKSLRENQRRAIEEIAAAEKHLGNE